MKLFHRKAATASPRPERQSKESEEPLPELSVTVDGLPVKLPMHRAYCSVDVVAPNRQDSAFPTYVAIGPHPEGLAVAFDAASAAKLDGFTRAAVIGEYHWLNSVNSTEPVVMSYKDIETVTCDFYERQGNIWSWVKSEQGPIESVRDDVELKLALVYHNRGKGTTLHVEFQCRDNDKPYNKATLFFYDSIRGGVQLFGPSPKL